MSMSPHSQHGAARTVENVPDGYAIIIRDQSSPKGYWFAYAYIDRDTAEKVNGKVGKAGEIVPIYFNAAPQVPAANPSASAPILDEFSEFIGRLSDLAHSSSFWAEKPYSNRLYYGIGNGDYIARDILQAFLHTLKTNARTGGGA